MIKINLLNNIEYQSIPEKSSPSPSSGKKRLAIIFATIGIILCAGVIYITLFNESATSPTAKATQNSNEITDPPQTPQSSIGFGESHKYPKNQPQPPNKVIMAHAVEETVKEIEGEHRSKNPSKTARDIKAPSRVAYQLYIHTKVLGFIQDVTPPDIGFTDLIVSSPGDIYIRGIARSRVHYQSFLTKLKNSPVISVKPGILKKVGDDKTAREFSIYGKCKFRKPSSLPNRIVSKNRVQNVLASLESNAQFTGVQFGGLRQTARSTIGSYQRRLYKAQISDCDYPQFQNFIFRLKKNQSKIGILKFALRSDSDERLNANLDLVLYTY